MNTKPKVLFVMHMPPPVHGVSIMGKTIHDSKLINESFECMYVNETMSDSVDQVGQGGMSKLLKLFKHIRNIKSIIKSFRPDLVYITPSGTNPCLSIFIRYVFEFSMLNRAGCHKLIHFHDKGEKKQTEKWWAKWYYKVLFKNADVIFLSRLLVPQYKSFLNETQIHICPNGIPETLSEEPKAQRQNQDCRLLYLSNMMVSKGVYVLLDAIAELKNRGLQVSCDFVGGWKDITPTDFESRCVSLGIKDIVTAHGPKYGDDKLPYLKNADIFVFPTFYKGECFPLVLLEAMEYKLPLISTDNGAIEEIVQNGNTGYVCKQNDKLTLVNNLEKLVNDKVLRESLGENSYKEFKSHFTVKCFENCMRDIIQKVLEKNEK